MTDRIFHLALRSEWDAARGRTYYDRSTLGRSLAEVGFVHCSRADQWQRVRDLVYADVAEPLVLLTIATDRLEAPVVDEPGEPGSADPSAETFPHVYGAIPVAAVVEVTPLRGPAEGPTTGDRPSFTRALATEVALRMGLALLVMGLSVAVGTAAEAAAGQPAGLVAALAGLVLGTVAAVLAYRRWERRTSG